MAAELEGFVRGLWNERDLKKKEDMTPFEPFDAHFSRGSGWRKPEDRSSGRRRHDIVSFFPLSLSSQINRF